MVKTSDPMRAVIFAGTSIRHEDAKAILDVKYMPPVARGDVEKVAAQGYDIIGIIDGMFFDKAAVAHKEIIHAMKKGITVVGGCSMGALRAAELDVHGMIGVGKVYGWYRDGVLESDDEVAVTTNPDTFESVSIPLVNIRETLRSACSEGIIDEAAQQALLKISMDTYYPHRSYLGIVKTAVDNGHLSEKEPLLSYCLDHEVDIKRADAILVLEKVKELLSN